MVNFTLQHLYFIPHTLNFYYNFRILLPYEKHLQQQEQGKQKLPKNSNKIKSDPMENIINLASVCTIFFLLM